MNRSSSVGVQERGTHSVPLKLIATGCCGGQKHKDVKGFTSKILRFMKGKVTADGHSFWLNQWWMDRAVK